LVKLAFTYKLVRGVRQFLRWRVEDGKCIFRVGWIPFSPIVEGRKVRFQLEVDFKSNGRHLACQQI
jgi:hypothetical protein